ncbi:MAG: succinylglutamate desuccinylase/aspartoacylase family protein [Saprospiraceae bacterium]
MEINGNIINPGENKTLKIRVGKLPSGTSISIVSHVFRSINPGKTILLLGGVHGDEINGIEILRSAIEKKYFDDLKSGTVIVVPVLNIFGFINYNRDVNNGKDLNRSFPGSENGSLAARVAKKFTNFFLLHADIVIDFHTGGDTRYNFPQIRYSQKDKDAFELAKVFNPLL